MEKEIHLIQYLGKRRALIHHYINLFLFGLLTIGFYSCWGLTDIRKYLIRNIQIGQDRLAYSGKGQHRFLAGILILLYNILLHFFQKLTSYVVVGYVTNATLAIFYTYFSAFVGFMGFIICYQMYGYCSWRYVLAHLSWRGMRGSFQGSWWRYVVLYMYRNCLNILSLAFLTPWSDLVKYRYRVNHSYVGNIPLSFQPVSIKKLVRTHVKTLLLFPFTLGLSRLWYQAALRNHQWNHTAVGNLRLRSTYTGWGLFKLYIGNFFLLFAPFAVILICMYILKILHLAMGMLVVGYVVCGFMFFACLAGLMPVAVHRTARYKTQHTAVLGDLELFFEAHKETLSAEPVNLPRIDFGVVFPI